MHSVCYARATTFQADVGSVVLLIVPFSVECNAANFFFILLLWNTGTQNSKYYFNTQKKLLQVFETFAEFSHQQSQKRSH